MSVLVLETNIAASAGDKTSRLAGVTPFLPERTVTAHIVTDTSIDGSPVYAIDGSDDNSTWVEIFNITKVGHHVVDIACKKYMRLSVTTAATTAGTISAWLEEAG